MKYLKLILLSSMFMILATGCEDKDYCVKYQGNMVCPQSNSSLAKALLSLKDVDISNDGDVATRYERVLAMGGDMRLDITPGFEGYMTIISINHDGKRSQLFPNKYAPDNFVDKAKPIRIHSQKYHLKATKTAGLGYLVVVVTQKRVLFSVHTKNGNFDAFANDAALKSVIEDIGSGKYGKHYIGLLPYYIYKEKK